MSAVIEVEACPGHLTWSAFGASYPDTVCSSALTSTDGLPLPSGVLADADDDFRLADIPCPFCDPAGFAEYQFGGWCNVPLCGVDEARLPEGTAIHFHDATALWWSAECPDHGEQRVLVRDMSEVDGFDGDTFKPFDWSAVAS